MARISPLDLFLRRIISNGSLTVAYADGCVLSYGDGSGPKLGFRLKDRRTEWEIALDPRLKLAEAYMDGRLVPENGGIDALIALFVRNARSANAPFWLKLIDDLRYRFRRFQQFNPMFRARRNASHHYDIRRDIYDLFLDIDKQYSCAYFERADMTLEAAQQAKKRRIAAKLAIPKHARVLDIGSGWGGLAIYLAKVADAQVTGITLSAEQLDVARERARRLGLDRRVTFELMDYRALSGVYDRIVSVGMFEHVGVPHYRRYFRTLADLLAENGVALVHSIGRSGPPGSTNPFIAKYIFPGGYIPSLSEVLPAIERAGLIVTDVEVLRLHYAETLKEWRRRFLANWDKAKALMGERFCRMWEFYLAGSEMAFRHENLVVFQIQLAKSLHALPLTRRYIDEEAERLARNEETQRIRYA
jgi:cyclopropane-fatty-acyl-phospholipid synthase